MLIASMPPPLGGTLNCTQAFVLLICTSYLYDFWG